MRLRGFCCGLRRAGVRLGTAKVKTHPVRASGAPGRTNPAEPIFFFCALARGFAGPAGGVVARCVCALRGWLASWLAGSTGP